MLGRLRLMDFNGAGLLFLINKVDASAYASQTVFPLLLVIVVASYDTNMMPNCFNTKTR